MAVFTTNDGVSLHYAVQGEGPTLLMVPGWTCTMGFFRHNIDELAARCRVITLDYRGHGESEKVEHSHRIARYAMDIRNLLDHLHARDVTLLGWSMGAAILWSYLELFGYDRVSKLVCVDQSPAQYTGPDWQWGQNGCYDVEMFVRLACAIEYDPRGNAEGLAYACLHRTPTADEVKFLADEISKCPPKVRIEIMRDHTNLDWRDFLPHIKVPTLVCVGRHSAVFDWEGSAYVGEQIPGARTVFFEDSGHMLFWEEPEKFNRVVGDFVTE